ncbi:hypothetical protein [Streptomyces sp. NPDC053427]|uniref:NHL domain-containing protein n=1 Tax=Streptomyces sp. NPDC053427 TaxID=3365701 RepID=UPI0037CD3F7A
MAVMDELLRDEEGEPAAGAVDTAGTVEPGTMLNVAGTGEEAPEKQGGGGEGDGGKATTVRLGRPTGAAADGAGTFFFCDNNRVRKVTPDGTITTLAGLGTGEQMVPRGQEAKKFNLVCPAAVAQGPDGSLYVADWKDDRVNKIAADGTVWPVAGNGQRAKEQRGKAEGDGRKATEAPLRWPTDLAMDRAGNLFIAEDVRVRRVAPDGTIDTVAGNGTETPAKDGSRATLSGFTGIQGIAVNAAGDLYIAETKTHRVLKVSRGVLTIVAGTGKGGFNGDGGKAVEATLWRPLVLAFDQYGNLYIGEVQNQRVRRVTPDGRISTVAGNGTEGGKGDGGPATGAQLGIVTGLTVDHNGNLFIVDSLTHRVRMVVQAARPPRKIRTVRTLSGFDRLNNQHAKPGEPFGQPLQVEARDTNGEFVPGARIRFEVDAGTGSTFAAQKPGRTAEADTNDDGLATAPELLAGPTPGQATVTITAPGHKGHAPTRYTAHVDPLD